jgi:hypothetical protein
MSGRSGRHLYPITEGGSTDVAGGLTSGPKDSGVPSPSGSSPSSRDDASYSKASNWQHGGNGRHRSGTGGLSASGDSWGASGKTAAGKAAGDLSGSGELGIAPIAPTWRTANSAVITQGQHSAHFQDSSNLDASMDLSEQEEQEVQISRGGHHSSTTAAATGTTYGRPHSRGTAVLPDFVPTTSLPSRGQQGFVSTGAGSQQQQQQQQAPAAVFGLTRPPAPPSASGMSACGGLAY